MKHHVLGSLTAAFLMSSVGAPLASLAQQVDESDQSPLRESADNANVAAGAPFLASEETSPTASAATMSHSAVDVHPLSINAATEAVAPVSRALAMRDQSIVIVNAHPFDRRQAATLYVRQLPVLTFIGDELTSLAADKATVVGIGDPGTEAEPVYRATQVGAHIDQFHKTSGSAADISVRWDGEQEAYIVSLGEEELVTIDDQTVLPDTTQDLAQDALQVTNRLRRLLGGADPLDQVEGMPQPTPVRQVAAVMTGMASWYGPGFHGRRSASGEVFNQNAFTAAHRTLPFGTQVRVTNMQTGVSVVVRINDRGPFSGGRVLDLSAGAARQIGLERAGVGMVRMEVLSN